MTAVFLIPFCYAVPKSSISLRNRQHHSHSCRSPRSILRCTSAPRHPRSSVIPQHPPRNNPIPQKFMETTQVLMTISELKKRALPNLASSPALLKLPAPVPCANKTSSSRSSRPKAKKKATSSPKASSRSCPTATASSAPRTTTTSPAPTTSTSPPLRSASSISRPATPSPATSAPPTRAKNTLPWSRSRPLTLSPPKRPATRSSSTTSPPSIPRNTSRWRP